MIRFIALVSGVVISVFFLSGLNSAQALQFDKGQVLLEELSDYELCQTKDYTGEWCQDGLKRWVKAHPADAFEAGKMTRKAMNHWAAIPYFAQSFDAKKGHCKDEDVKLSVVSALNLPESNQAVIASAKKIGIESCFSEMKGAILEAATLDSYLFKNTCKDLMAKGALTGLKKKKCEASK